MRQQLAEQLAVSRGLTKKTQDVDSSADDDDDDDHPNDNENIPDLALAQDPLNPWMLKQSNKSNVSAEFDFGYKKYVQSKISNKNNDSESNSEDDEKSDGDKEKISNELSVLSKSINRMTQNVSDITDEINILEGKSNSHSNDAFSEYDDETRDTKPCSSMTKKKTVISKNKILATSNWVVETIDNSDEPKATDITTAFDSLEETVADKLERKLKQLRKKLKQMDKNTKRGEGKGSNTKKKNSEFDNLEYLKMKSKKIRPIIDEELIETGSKDLPDGSTSIQQQEKIENTATSSVQAAENNIDPNRFIAVKPKFLNTALPADDNGMDMLDDDEQVVPRVNIEEVFEEDDVVASFRQEKEDEANKDNPKDIDLSLPGWGSWGGKGVKAPKRKRSRFILRAPPKTPRRDENKGDIIIREYKDPKLASHKVKEVPFPFQSVKDFEASIRAPLGNTFIPEKAHKLLIKPSVITKAGAIIEPMDEDELLLKKNKHFKKNKGSKSFGMKVKL